MSTLITNTVQGVQNIKYDASTTAMTIDSAGRVVSPAKPAFMARRTSNQSTGVVIFDTAVVNQGSHYDTSTGKFTAPVAGVYSFSTVVLSNNDGTDNYFRSEIHINGTTYAVSQAYTFSDNDFGSSFSTVASLSANDYVQVVAVTAPVYGSGNTNYTHFSGFLIG